MRHAKSSWDDPKLSDHARPLNTRGKQAAGAMRTVMRQLGLVPDVVLVSSARRTLQTLEALQPWDETPIVEPMDALYLADAEQMIRVLHSVTPTVRSVLVLAHNPGLHEMAMLLMDDSDGVVTSQSRRLAEGYPTGALTEFAISVAWNELAAGRGRLTRFLGPRDFPDLAA